MVDCSYKNLPHIDENMFNRTGAERIPGLNLENNQLTSLPDHIFDPFLGLKSLNLNHNRLRVLPVSLFSNLKYLEFLDMKGNLLSTLPVGLFAVQNELLSLDLSDNHFSTLDVKVITPLMNLKTLFFSGNPLVCDCRLQPVVMWDSVKLNNTVAICHSPPLYKDHSWYTVKSIECPSLLSAVTTIDSTPDLETHPSTPGTKTYTEVSPAETKQPGVVRRDFDLYPVSLALIAVLIILTVVLVSTMVFIHCYKRLHGGGQQFRDSCSE